MVCSLSSVIRIFQAPFVAGSASMKASIEKPAALEKRVVCLSVIEKFE
jgi:hypothetical protein